MFNRQVAWKLPYFNLHVDYVQEHKQVSLFLAFSWSLPGVREREKLSGDLAGERLQLLNKKIYLLILQRSSLQIGRVRNLVWGSEMAEEAQGRAHYYQF